MVVVLTDSVAVWFGWMRVPCGCVAMVGTQTFTVTTLLSYVQVPSVTRTQYCAVVAGLSLR
jgi:hypothetical protein